LYLFYFFVDFIWIAVLVYGSVLCVILVQFCVYAPLTTYQLLYLFIFSTLLYLLLVALVVLLLANLYLVFLSIFELFFALNYYSNRYPLMLEGNRYPLIIEESVNSNLLLLSSGTLISPMSPLSTILDSEFPSYAPSSYLGKRGHVVNGYTVLRHADLPSVIHLPGGLLDGKDYYIHVSRVPIKLVYHNLCGVRLWTLLHVDSARLSNKPVLVVIRRNEIFSWGTIVYNGLPGDTLLYRVHLSVPSLYS